MSKTIPCLHTAKFLLIRPFFLHHETFAKRSVTMSGIREKNTPTFEISLTLILRLNHEDVMYLAFYDCFKERKTIELWQDSFLKPVEGATSAKSTSDRYHQGKIVRWRKTAENGEIVEIELTVETNGIGIEIEANSL